MSEKSAVHLDLDGAWSELPLPRLTTPNWGPLLRFTTSAVLIERFACEVLPKLAPFVVYGSGDFHHLSAVWLRRISEPFTLISFDNHPDWDVRPPRWACGGWINRALELGPVQQIVVWGCGNFECWWPQRIWGNRKAERSGRLTVHPWADERSPREQRRPGAILRRNWRELFTQFAGAMAGRKVYLTIDLDCLAPEFACTNWENGRFTLEDLQWALGQIRQRAHVIAGDLCGAYSTPKYARRKQALAAQFDHPQVSLPAPDAIRATNRRAFDALWPLLTQ